MSVGGVSFAALPSAGRLDGALALRMRPGVGQKLLLLHGFTDTGDSYGLIAPHLPNPLWVPDLPGHGVSPPLPRMTLEALADSLVPVLQTEGPMRVVGPSMGALVALILAARLPDLVAGLVLISGALRPEGPEMVGLAAQIAALPDPLAPDDPFFAEWHRGARPVPEAFLDSLAQSAAAMRRCDWLDLIAALRAADLTGVAGRVKCPALLIAGDQDPIFPPAHARALAAALPQARLQLMAGHGHNPHWESPALVAALIGGKTEKAPHCRSAF